MLSCRGVVLLRTPKQFLNELYIYDSPMKSEALRFDFDEIKIWSVHSIIKENLPNGA
jgi:hypothetical protein